MVGVMQALPVIDTTGRQVMQTPEDVAQMLRLKAAGLGIKHIARKMGCSKNTVRRYLRNGDWVAYQAPERQGALHGLEAWLAERLQQHRGNADVVRQDLERLHGVTVSLRTVERAVAPFRRELRAAEIATVRFETAPGEQLQIDFGETTVSIADERVKVHLFVATLGYSRRPYVAVFEHERQAAWLTGIEGAFHYFRGRTLELLLDNAKALVNFHDARTREIRFNDRFHAFCRYWDVLPKARIGRAPRGRMSAAWATSSATRSPGMPSIRWRLWKLTSRGGCARWPTPACMAPPVRFRWSGLPSRKRPPCGPWRGAPRSSRCANASAASMPMPVSSWKPIATACHGG